VVRHLRLKWAHVIVSCCLCLPYHGAAVLAQELDNPVQAQCPEVFTTKKLMGEDGPCPGPAKGSNRTVSPSTLPTGGYVPVHFIAARVQDASRTYANRGFSSKFSADEILGLVHVRVPKGAQPGEDHFYEPTLIGGQVADRKRQSASYYIEDIIKFDEAGTSRQKSRDKFFQSLRTGSQDRDLLYYIHGINNTWTHAVERIAQIVHGTKFDGTVLIYSWPGDDGVTGLDMLSPARRIIWQVRSLVATSLLEVEQSRFRRVNLMTHSMGGRLAQEAIMLRLRSGSVARVARERHSIIMKAPEPSVIEFQDKLVSLDTWAGAITVYCSNADKVLMGLETLEKAVPRGQTLGLCAQPIDGTSWIDARVMMIEANPGDIDNPAKDSQWHNPIAQSSQGHSELARAFSGAAADERIYGRAESDLRHRLERAKQPPNQLLIKRH
jgi:esterase/lipase superfamily enzyme